MSRRKRHSHAPGPPRPTKPPLPATWLFTDPRIPHPALLRAAARLPRGSGIVLRHYALPTADRRTLYRQLARIGARRKLAILVARSGGAAERWHADAAGEHLGAPARTDPRHRARRGLVSMAVHDSRTLARAIRQGADLIFLSPLFATRSHPGARPLGSARFAALARRAPIPVMALGGVAGRHRRTIAMLGAQGYGAIDSLS